MNDDNPVSIANVVALARVLDEQGRYKEAIEVWEKIIESEIETTAYYLELAAICVKAMDMEKAKTVLDRAYAYSLPLTDELYKVGITAKKLFDMHSKATQERFAEHLAIAKSDFKNAKDKNKKLKVGFLSVGFGKHAVGYLTSNCFKNFIFDDVDIYLFAARDYEPDDEINAIYKNLPGAKWLDVSELGNYELHQYIIDHEIDILFCMDGLWQSGLLPIFALRAAPVQVSWADYPGTIGLPTIDYLLADRYHIPEEKSFEACYMEKIIRIPNDYICYTPPQNVPDVSELPCLESGFVTFGAFHNPAKIGEPMLRAWGDIMNSLENSRIIFKYRDFDKAEVQSRMLNVLEKEKGIARDRIVFIGHTEFEQHMKYYSTIDIYLDAHPYSAGLTACETLYMGVPVITCPGDTFSSRHSYSHVMNAGLSNLVAYDLDEYVKKVVELAKDTKQLKELRASLRDKIISSPLTDGALFAGYFRALMREIWSNYCDGY